MLISAGIYFALKLLAHLPIFQIMQFFLHAIAPAPARHSMKSCPFLYHKCRAKSLLSLTLLSSLTISVQLSLGIKYSKRLDQDLIFRYNFCLNDTQYRRTALLKGSLSYSKNKKSVLATHNIIKLYSITGSFQSPSDNIIHMKCEVCQKHTVAYPLF